MQKNYDAVIVGSGFGGAVTALRLVEAGKSVLVLERGKSYSQGDFPRDPKMLSETLWRYPEYQIEQGLFDIRFCSDAAVVCASGVGGGSLVYSNVNIKPDESMFANTPWPSSITLETLEPCFQRVESVMGLQAMPDSVSTTARTAIKKAGMETEAELLDPGYAIDWDACELCGECAIGCNSGAKLSMDKTYLKKAEEKGLTIRSQAWVYMIEPTFSGYYIHFRDLKNNGLKKQVKTRIVILAAGTMGTNELLFRNRDIYDTLPAVSSRLGKRFSVNGDLFGSIHNATQVLNAWRGNDIAAVLQYKNNTPFTVAAMGNARSSMEVIASLGQLSGKALTFFGPVIWRHLKRLFPWILSQGGLNQPLAIKLNSAGPVANFTNLFASGVDNSNGELVFKSSSLDIEWDFASENQPLITHMISKMEEIAENYGGHYSPIALWNMAHRSLSISPLGGCVMADSPESGVVSPVGEVFGHPKLYISDGSIIPGSLGYYPAMTISALAEHNAKDIVANLA